MADRSFISNSFAVHANQDVFSLDDELLITTPLGEEIVKKKIYNDCEVKIGEVVLGANLIPIEMHDFDVILGMDWLESHHAIVTFFTKTVEFHKPSVSTVTF